MYSLAACSPSSAAGSDTSSLAPLVTVLFELLTRLAAGLTASIRHSWRPLAAGAVLSSAVKSLESGAEVFANLAKSADRSRGLVVRAGNVPEYASPGGSKKRKKKKELPMKNVSLCTYQLQMLYKCHKNKQNQHFLHASKQTGWQDHMAGNIVLSCQKCSIKNSSRRRREVMTLSRDFWPLFLRLCPIWAPYSYAKALSRIWFPFRGDIRICKKKLGSIIDTAESKVINVIFKRFC